VVAAAITWVGMRKHRGGVSAEAASSNPLQVMTALQMAVLFQAVLFVLRWAQATWGRGGVFVLACAAALVWVG
jgi:uncharacterized membrane protein (DUF4010 family)